MELYEKILLIYLAVFLGASLIFVLYQIIRNPRLVGQNTRKLLFWTFLILLSVGSYIGIYMLYSSLPQLMTRRAMVFAYFVIATLFIIFSFVAYLNDFKWDKVEFFREWAIKCSYLGQEEDSDLSPLLAGTHLLQPQSSSSYNSGLNLVAVTVEGKCK